MTTLRYFHVKMPFRFYQIWWLIVFFLFFVLNIQTQNKKCEGNSLRTHQKNIWRKKKEMKSDDTMRNLLFLSSAPVLLILSYTDGANGTAINGNTPSLFSKNTFYKIFFLSERKNRISNAPSFFSSYYCVVCCYFVSLFLVCSQNYFSRSNEVILSSFPAKRIFISSKIWYSKDNNQKTCSLKYYVYI